DVLARYVAMGDQAEPARHDVGQDAHVAQPSPGPPRRQTYDRRVTEHHVRLDPHRVDHGRGERGDAVGQPAAVRGVLGQHARALGRGRPPGPRPGCPPAAKPPRTAPWPGGLPGRTRSSRKAPTRWAPPAPWTGRT